MISHESSTLITLFLYAFSSLIGLTGMAIDKSFWKKLGCIISITAFISQTFILVTGFHKSFPTGLSLGAYLQLLAWFTLLCSIVAWIKFRQQVAIILASPLSLIFFILSAPYLEQFIKVPEGLKASFYTLHIGSLFLSLGLLTLSFVTSIAFLLLENRIKSKKRIASFLQNMPALGILDNINIFTTVTGFILYTVGIISGLIWARQIFGSMANWDPKEIISIMIWILYAILFQKRLINEWKGRKPAKVTIYIYLLSLFSIFIINSFFKTYHAFIQ